MIAWLEDDDGIAWLRRATVFLFLAGLLAFIARGADGPDDPFLKPPPPGASTPATAPAGPPPTALPGG